MGPNDRLVSKNGTVCYMTLYSNMMRQNGQWHIVQFLYFMDNWIIADRTEENYDTLWKLRGIFGILKKTKEHNTRQNFNIRIRNFDTNKER